MNDNDQPLKLHLIQEVSDYAYEYAIDRQVCLKVCV